MATYERLSSGRWRARIEVITADGRRRRVSRTADTKRELTALVADVQLNGSTPARGGDSLAALVERYFDSSVVARKRPATNAKHRRELERYVLPVLGDVALRRLTPARLDALYGDLLKRLAPSTVSEVHAKISTVLAQAVRWGEIPANPCDLATAPGGKAAKVDPPSDAQVRALLEHAEVIAEQRPWWPALLRLAVATGARQGELVAARWEDLADDRWSIRRTRSYNVGVYEIAEPKTAAGRRTISIDATTLAALEGWRQHCGGPTAGWVWPGSVSEERPIGASTVNGVWGKAREATGVTCRFHDLRHYHATVLLAAGVDVRTVAGRLGHERPSVTLNVYAAWMPSRDSAAADMIGDLLA